MSCSMANFHYFQSDSTIIPRSLLLPQRVFCLVFGLVPLHNRSLVSKYVIQLGNILCRYHRMNSFQTLLSALLSGE
jgi:hypothetical protein